MTKLPHPPSDPPRKASTRKAKVVDTTKPSSLTARVFTVFCQACDARTAKQLSSVESSGSHDGVTMTAGLPYEFALECVNELLVADNPTACLSMDCFVQLVAYSYTAEAAAISGEAQKKAKQRLKRGSSNVGISSSASSRSLSASGSIPDLSATISSSSQMESSGSTNNMRKKRSTLRGGPKPAEMIWIGEWYYTRTLPIDSALPRLLQYEDVFRIATILEHMLEFFEKVRQPDGSVALSNEKKAQQVLSEIGIPKSTVGDANNADPEVLLVSHAFDRFQEHDEMCGRAVWYFDQFVRSWITTDRDKVALRQFALEPSYQPIWLKQRLNLAGWQSTGLEAAVRDALLSLVGQAPEPPPPREFALRAPPAAWAAMLIAVPLDEFEKWRSGMSDDTLLSPRSPKASSPKSFSPVASRVPDLSLYQDLVAILPIQYRIPPSCTAPLQWYFKLSPECNKSAFTAVLTKLSKVYLTLFASNGRVIQKVKEAVPATLETLTAAQLTLAAGSWPALERALVPLTATRRESGGFAWQFYQLFHFLGVYSIELDAFTSLSKGAKVMTFSEVTMWVYHQMQHMMFCPFAECAQMDWILSAMFVWKSSQELIITDASFDVPTERTRAANPQVTFGEYVLLNQALHNPEVISIWVKRVFKVVFQIQKLISFKETVLYLWGLFGLSPPGTPVAGDRLANEWAELCNCITNVRAQRSSKVQTLFRDVEASTKINCDFACDMLVYAGALQSLLLVHGAPDGATYFNAPPFLAVRGNRIAGEGLRQAIAELPYVSIPESALASLPDSFFFLALKKRVLQPFPGDSSEEYLSYGIDALGLLSLWSFLVRFSGEFEQFKITTKLEGSCWSQRSVENFVLSQKLSQHRLAQPFLSQFFLAFNVSPTSRMGCAEFLQKRLELDSLVRLMQAMEELMPAKTVAKINALRDSSDAEGAEAGAEQGLPVKAVYDENALISYLSVLQGMQKIGYIQCAETLALPFSKLLQSLGKFRTKGAPAALQEASVNSETAFAAITFAVDVIEWLHKTTMTLVWIDVGSWMSVNDSPKAYMGVLEALCDTMKSPFVGDALLAAPVLSCCVWCVDDIVNFVNLGEKFVKLEADFRKEKLEALREWLQHEPLLAGARQPIAAGAVECVLGAIRQALPLTSALADGARSGKGDRAITVTASEMYTIALAKFTCEYVGDPCEVFLKQAWCESDHPGAISEETFNAALGRWVASVFCDRIVKPSPSGDRSLVFFTAAHMAPALAEVEVDMSIAIHFKWVAKRNPIELLFRLLKGTYSPLSDHRSVLAFRRCVQTIGELRKATGSRAVNDDDPVPYLQTVLALCDQTKLVRSSDVECVHRLLVRRCEAYAGRTSMQLPVELPMSEMVRLWCMTRFIVSVMKAMHVRPEGIPTGQFTLQEVWAKAGEGLVDFVEFLEGTVA